MRVGGHRVREHLLLLKPLFIFIALVWLIRLILGLLEHRWRFQKSSL
jgi:hypothetical protein